MGRSLGVRGVLDSLHRHGDLSRSDHGSRDMWRNEDIAVWLHRVGESWPSGQDPCSPSMDSDLWLWGVHLGSGLYSNLRNSSNCLHFWSRGVVISRACAGKLRGPKSGQKRRTLGPSKGLLVEFLEF